MSLQNSCRCVTILLVLLFSLPTVGSCADLQEASVESTVTSAAALLTAIEEAPEGSVIQVAPGCYTFSSTIKITRSLSIRGSAISPEKVQLEVIHGDAIVITAESANITGVSVTALAGGGVLFLNGQSELSRCQISAQGVETAGIGIAGASTTPTISECQISRCSNVGVQISHNADPRISNCRIHDNLIGVMVSEHGQGEFSQCSINRNIQAGLLIRSEGNPTLSGCQLFHNAQFGVACHGNGRGVLGDCEVHGNSWGITTWGPGSRFCARNCNIYDNAESGIALKRDGQGEFLNNRLWENGNSSPDNWDVQPTAGRVVREGNVDHPYERHLWHSVAYDLSKAIHEADDDTRITLKPGVYRLPSSLSISRSVSIVGDAEFPGRVVLDCRNGAEIEITRGQVTLSGVYIRARGQRALSVRGGKVSLSDSWVRNSGYCIGVLASEAQVVVDQCELFCSKGGAALLSGSLSLQRCWLYGNTGPGVGNVGEDGELTLEHCRIYGNTGGGVLSCGGECRVVACDLAHNKYGVSVGNGNTETSIVDCRIFMNKSQGVEADGGSHVRLEDNKLFWNDTAVLTRQASIDLTNCDVYENRGFGIACEGGSQATLVECAIRNNAFSGVIANLRCSVEAAQCRIHHNSESGLILSNNSIADLMNCRIQENGKSGVMIETAESKATQPSDSRQKGSTIRDCVIRFNGSYGVDIGWQCRVEFRNCEFYRNSYEDIRQPGKSLATFEVCHEYKDISTCNLCFKHFFDKSVWASREKDTDRMPEQDDAEDGNRFKAVEALAKQGDPEAQYELSLYYGDKGDGDASLRWMRQAADQDYRDAQLLLALTFMNAGPSMIAYAGTVEGAESVESLEDEWLKNLSQSAEWLERLSQRGRTIPEEVLEFRRCEINAWLRSYDQHMAWIDHVRRNPTRMIEQPTAIPYENGRVSASQVIAALSPARSRIKTNEVADRMTISEAELKIARIRLEVKLAILPTLKYFYAPGSEEYARISEKCEVIATD